MLKGEDTTFIKCDIRHIGPELINGWMDDKARVKILLNMVLTHLFLEFGSVNLKIKFGLLPLSLFLIVQCALQNENRLCAWFVPLVCLCSFSLHHVEEVSHLVLSVGQCSFDADVISEHTNHYAE